LALILLAGLIGFISPWAQANPIVPPMGRFVLKVESINCDPKEVAVGEIARIDFTVRAEGSGWVEGYYAYAIVYTPAGGRIVASEALLENRFVYAGQRFHGGLSVRVPEDAKPGPIVVMFWQKPARPYYIYQYGMAELPTNVELWLLGSIKPPPQPPTTVTATITATATSLLTITERVEAGPRGDAWPYALLAIALALIALAAVMAWRRGPARPSKRICLECGAILPIGAKFCTECGKKVPEAPPRSCMGTRGSNGP